MNRSAQKISHNNAGSTAFASNSRASWIGSKIMQSIGVETDRMDAVHNTMLLLILQDGGQPSLIEGSEGEQLAAKIVTIARVAEQAAAAGGPNAAMAAVMRESGKSVDPMLAQNFLRLASSPIFWMALDSAGEARSN